MGVSFRHSAGFGKRMEYHLIGQMLMEGLDCYVPLVDDHGVDCIIKKEDGTFIEIQIKARSREVANGDAALFSDIHRSGVERNRHGLFVAKLCGPVGVRSFAADGVAEVEEKFGG